MRLAEEIRTIAHGLSSLEAYYQRGAKDKRLSTDFEDVVYVLENRKEFIDDVIDTDKSVNEFIAAFAKKMLSENDTEEAIGAVMGYAPLAERINFVRSILRKLSDK